MSNEAGITRKGLVKIDAQALADLIASGDVQLIDVREEAEFAEERIPGSVLMPLSTFDPDALPPASTGRVVVICAIGRRSMKAASLLLDAGHDSVSCLDGGLLAWEMAGYETESEGGIESGRAA